jgi:hypothetical protein
MNNNSVMFDVQNRIYLLSRINTLENINENLTKENKNKRKKIVELEHQKNKLIDDYLSKEKSENTCTKKHKKNTFITTTIQKQNNLLISINYKYMSVIERNDQLSILFKNMSNINDIIEFENNPFKCDFINNDKFKKLYNLIPNLKKIQCMIGMDNIKKEIFKHVCYFIQGLQNNLELMHIVITGPPGVGKTEVGKILSGIYLNLDFLTSEKFIIAKRSDLIGEYLGQTAVKTQKVINEVEGGVLFIDEVYSLGNEEKRDSFSKECIDTINLNLTENKGKFLCIIAGYKDKIEKCFFSYNEGLRRRFPINYNIIEYTPEELKKILLKKIKDDDWILEDDTVAPVSFFKDNLNYFKYFGGDIELLLQQAKIHSSIRIMKSTIDLKCTKIINNNDINTAFIDIFKNRDKEDDYKHPPLHMYI